MFASSPVILGERQRRGHDRTPFRMQSARGLLRTTADDLCCHPPRQSSASLRTRTVRQWARGGPLARRSGTVGSQRDDRPQFLLATGNGPQRDVDTGQVESGGVAPRWLLSEPLRRAASVESLSRNHRSWMSTGSNGSPVPGHYLLVLLVQRIQPRLKELHEAGDAADVLRRAPPLAGNERRVVDSGSHSDARSSVAAPGRCRAQTFGLGADAATGVVDRPRPV